MSVGNIQCQLKEKCKDVVEYSTATDESADITDIMQLVLYEVLMRTIKEWRNF
jgi:hypothetical protein